VDGERKSRVLVIEDTDEIRELIGIALRKAGLEPELAGTGSKGLELFGSSEYDAVVLDMHMPGIDGLETCRTIRRDSTIPILLVSGSAEGHGRRVSQEAGADDFMEKPFRPAKLAQRVKELLGESAED
jgi:two-component system, OmpR family, response regulator